MFVTPSDFAFKPYKLINLDVLDDAFTTFIDKMEAKMLRKILGGSLYDSFINGLAALPPLWSSTKVGGYAVDALVYNGLYIWRSLQDANSEVPAEGEYWTKMEKSIWLALRDGDDYILTTNKHRYRWFGMNEAFVPYIYSEWLRATNENEGDFGLTKTKVENAENISPARRIANAYNEFSDKIGSKHHQKDTLYGYITQTNIADNSTFDGTFDDTFNSFASYFEFNFKGPKKQNFLSL